MDLETLQIPLICGAFFILASVLLSIVYKFGMKEKSYEEALAEQRQNTQSLLVAKQKPKEKKTKKNVKKVKDKTQEDKKVEHDKQEVKGILKTEKPSNESNQKQKQETKPKIKFNKVILKSGDEVDDFVEATTSVKDSANDKPESAKVKVIIETKKDEQQKKEAIKEKTVTIKKEDQPKKDTVKDKPSNKKEEITKDKASNTIKKHDNQPQKEIVGRDKIEEVIKDDKPLVKEVVNEKHLLEPLVEHVVNVSKLREKREIEEKVQLSAKAPLTNGYIMNSTKDKKKKKNELNALQQLTAAPGGPGMAFILNMVHKADLSHPDIQVLIDLLLNKQLNSPSVLDDWSEGKSDPVQKLKKQLAEKEKALADEQETLAGVQMKLKEVRNEQLAERSALNHKVKALEEQLQNHQMEIHACNSRYHGQSQQLQQAQMQLNEERIKLHSMSEELGAVQMQRQQLEMHIAQESEVMIAQLRLELQEFSVRNEQLLIDINHIQKEAMEKEASYVAQLKNITQELNDKNRQAKTEMMNQHRLDMQEISVRNEQILMDLNHVQKELHDKEASFVAQLNNLTQELNEKNRQIKNLSMELANSTETLSRQEDEYKTDIAQVNAVMQQQAEEISKTEQGKEDLMEEINNLKKQKNISNKVIAQLKAEIEKLQEEKSQNDASIENNKVNETEVLNLKNELTSLKNKLEENDKKFKTELESKANLMSKLGSDLEEQKTKNNELRNKNYKIMEALNAAESRIKNGQVENCNNEKNSLGDKATEIESQKKFVSRLLPEVNGLEDITTEKWEEECLRVVRNYLEGLKKNAGSDSTENLQARIEQYQNVIKDTEGMLNKLQAHIDQEQISWKAQIKSKDLELEALKEKLEKSQKLETINGSSLEGQ